MLNSSEKTNSKVLGEKVGYCVGVPLGDALGVRETVGAGVIVGTCVFGGW
jgi:hypothetical protein